MLVKAFKVLLFWAIVLVYFSCVESRLTESNPFKKEYVRTPLPVFQDCKDKLPIPVIEDNDKWLDMYWAAWSRIFENLRQPYEGSPFVANYIDEGFNDNIFQWDTNFMLLFGKYGHHVFPFIESHDNFYISQHDDGYICREISEKDGSDFIFAHVDNTMNGPLFGWVEIEYYKFTGDTDRLRKVLPILEKYAEYIEVGRKWTYTRHQLYWQTMLGSGMDNLNRFGVGWVDMSSQVVMLYSSLIEMSQITGDHKKANEYKLKNDSIKNNINYWMWNEDLGLYCNVNFQAEQIEAKNIAAFWPLIAEIPDKKQAQTLVKQAMDTNTFFRNIPFATLAATEKGYKKYGNYWQGGVWAPTNYMLLKGMEKYGFDKEAYKASCRYLSEVYKDFIETGTFWEFYSPEKGFKSYREDSIYRGPFDQPGQYWAKPDYGWSWLIPITILIENVIGITVDGPNNRIYWNINRFDKHGIRQLNIGKQTISLVYHPSKNGKPAYIETDVEFPIELHLNKDNKKVTLNIENKTSRVELE